MPKYIFQLRREDSEYWATENPVLRYGEPAVEEDTNKMKIGDGYTPWNLLDYLHADGGAPSEPFYHKHVQSLSSASWIVVHNLGKHPNVSVYINDELHIVPVQPINLNTLHIPFATPQTGYVICS